MSFLKKLFGGGGGKPAEEATVAAEEAYKGYRIAAVPQPEGGQYRLAATISGEVDGAERTHQLIRADLFPSRDEAAAFAIRKAKQMIDEQGDSLFGA